MTSTPVAAWPLVTIIIPCYNHGTYLPDALASIWQQHYPALEVIVVDDGSTDTTRQVVAAYPSVTYLHQPNQGLSAARNTGVARSTGQCLVFLDADDWLLPDALRTNVVYLQRNPALAFVSGGHDKVFVATGVTQAETHAVTSDHYRHLLQGNYIGMHATVMYQRWVFDEFAYDTTLRAVEDYDLYLRVAREYPVAHHTRRVAAYRRHASNMSGNIPLMLSTVLLVLRRQRQQLRSPAERQAYARGQRVWQDYYSRELYHTLRQPSARTAAWAEGWLLLIHQPPLALRYAVLATATMVKKLLKQCAPASGLRFLLKAGLYPGYCPAVGQVVLGDLARTSPLSTEFGYDRGGPVDRYYIEGFLQAHAPTIRGRVLEIGDNAYTLRFGQGVTQSDILHVDESNPHATFIGDLSHAPHLPDNAFDCIVLTQTLHLIYDYKLALATCHRVLKPGGVLLLTVPGITPIDRGEWQRTWYWSFTDRALVRLFAEVFPGEATITSYGNVLIATAFLYGLGRGEVTTEQLDYYDPQFQVINSVKAVKA
ncbi:glycosyltransferase [Hymenobacter sp. HD11105]